MDEPISQNQHLSPAYSRGGGGVLCHKINIKITHSPDKVQITYKLIIMQPTDRSSKVLHVY